MIAKPWAERTTLERTAVAAIVISALQQQLHGVCRAMESQAEIPDEYLAAMANAERVLAIALGLPAPFPQPPLTH